MRGNANRVEHQRNEHIGNGVLIFAKKGTAKRQTEVCRKKYYTNGEDYATL